MRFAVFCYDFPHWKTQTGLLALYANELAPEVVVGAPWVKVSIVPSSIRVVHKDLYLMDPKLICKRFGFNYVSKRHNEYDFSGLDFGVILGARILSKQTIDQFKLGVINIHPGILPQNRGLDNVKWAILKGFPQGATAHFINEFVDSGRVIRKSEIPVYRDDSLQDIQFRVQNKEIEVMIDSIKDPEGRDEIDKNNQTFKCMNWIEETEMLKRFEDYKGRWAK